MGRSDQENAEVKDFMGLGRDTQYAGCPEAIKPVYASSRMGGGQSKHIYSTEMVPPMYRVDPHMGSAQHYADTIAAVKSNILDAVQRPPASAWLYNNNISLPNGSLAFAGMAHPDWNNPGSRPQQFFSFNSSQEKRSGVEKVNDAYQIMHARGHGNALNCNHLPANGLPDPSGSRTKVFPFVAPVLHEQASPARSVCHIPSATSQAPTSPLLVGGAPSTRTQPAESSIKPSNTQLTIFYAGRVNVYNDVSSAKAQEIMLMAASGSSLPLNTPPLSGSLKNADPLELSRIDPYTCQPNEVGIGSFHTSIPQAPQAEESCVPGSQSTYLDDGPACPPALPQARKASLTRFLERRKERVLSKSAPYPVEKTFL